MKKKDIYEIEQNIQINMKWKENDDRYKYEKKIRDRQLNEKEKSDTYKIE